MEIVKLKTGEKGIIIIPEKFLNDRVNHYTLNLVLTENGHYVELSSDDFKKIGEIDDEVEDDQGSREIN